MPRPDDDATTRRAGARPAIVVLRAVGFVVALALGGVALWLIVTGGDSARRVQIGVLLGLWGVLLGAYVVFSSRNEHASVTPRAEDTAPGAALELRRAFELERAEDAAARRDYEARLAHMVRREIQSTVSGELSALRADLATLRGELLDNVGGQLRLERIETTRVIGSDIEALQREVDQLKANRARPELEHHPQEAQPVWRPEPSYARTRPAPPTPMDATAPFEPIRDEILAEIVEEEPPVREEQPSRQEPLAAREVHLSREVQPARQERPPREVQPASEEQPPRQEQPSREVQPSRQEAAEPEWPAPQPVFGSDPFAGLPRLRPFIDEPLELPEPRDTLAREHDAYQGRRRSDLAGRPLPTRHGSRHATEVPPIGGRRRRAVGDGNDTLDRILERESSHPSS